MILYYKDYYIFHGFTSLSFEICKGTTLEKLVKKKEWIVCKQDPDESYIEYAYEDGSAGINEVLVVHNHLFRSKSLADCKAYVDILLQNS